MKKTLTDAELLELREAFDLFDDDKTGRLSAQKLETLARALGLQITKFDARARVRAEKTRRGDPHCRIDFGTACSVLERWFSERDPEREIREAFRLFDRDGTGITERNLREVAAEVGEQGLDEGEFAAMIDEFDIDQDGRIDEREFGLMMTKLQH